MSNPSTPHSPPSGLSDADLAEAEAEEIARRAASAYWRKNLQAVAILLTIWAAVSFGCGILLADWLNQFRLPGTHFPLGFWFAQQGSMYVFVVLILIYVRWMSHLDRNYHPREVLKSALEEAEPSTTPPTGDDANPAANI